MKCPMLVIAFGIVGCSNAGSAGSSSSSQLNFVLSSTTSSLRAATIHGSTVVVVGDNSTALAGAPDRSNNLGFTKETLPVPSLDMRSAAWGNGTFVVGGGSANVFKSTGGSSWSTAGTLAAQNIDITGLALGEGRWIAAWAFDGVFYNDATLSAGWSAGSGSPSFSPSLESFSALTPLDGGGFVMVGAYGDVRTSTDGKAWSAATTPTYTQPNLNGVASNGQTVVAVGASGTVWLSTDGGTTWETGAIGTGDLNAVAYGNGLYVAVGANGAFLTSPTGTAWTPHYTGTTNNLYAVAVGRSGTLEGTIVAVGDTGTILQGSVCDDYDTKTLAASCICSNPCGADSLCYDGACIPPATNTGISVSPTGAQMSFHGVGNITYDIDATSDLGSGAWSAIGSRIASASGDFAFLDTAASSYSSRFYRALPRNGMY